MGVKREGLGASMDRAVHLRRGAARCSQAECCGPEVFAPRSGEDASLGSEDGRGRARGGSGEAALATGGGPLALHLRRRRLVCFLEPLGRRGERRRGFLELLARGGRRLGTGTCGRLVVGRDAFWVLLVDVDVGEGVPDLDRVDVEGRHVAEFMQGEKVTLDSTSVAIDSAEDHAALGEHVVSDEREGVRLRAVDLRPGQDMLQRLRLGSLQRRDLRTFDSACDEEPWLVARIRGGIQHTRMQEGCTQAANGSREQAPPHGLPWRAMLWMEK